MFNWFKRRSEQSKSFASNEEWMEGLRNPPDERAVKQLRQTLVRGLKPALSKYVDRELEDFVEDVAQDALLKILDNVESFRGESKFTTWAMKIAVREGLTELRRKRYDDISIDDLKAEPGDREIFSMSMADTGPEPDHDTHQSQIMEMVMRIMDEELTEKQRTAIRALMVHGLPITVVAEQMDTNRNALYKVVHDARLKLKNRLQKEGVDPEELLKKW
ncbi:MAG: sigma-70 family RNA polymerase sigma factor [Balneolaceae bacterium]|nr:sigma-70 family RNA polymerase sigma factor [Balneolaceae bacterium]